MSVWNIKEAKANLTELINQSMISPQVISLHGVQEVVVLSIQDYTRLRKSEENIVSFFRNSPLNGLDIEFTRDSI